MPPTLALYVDKILSHADIRSSAERKRTEGRLKNKSTRSAYHNQTFEKE
jgi:hypothetical protein